MKEVSRHFEVKAGMVAKYFKGQPNRQIKAVESVNFSLEKNEVLGIAGESGCGKSTLARLITMIEKPTSGDFEVDGINAVTSGPEEMKALRSKVQIVFQDPYGSLNPRKKVGSILEEPIKINTDLTKAQRREKSLAMMEKVGLSKEQYSRYPHMFSGGQRQRIAVARALITQPKLVMADEPTANLDKKSSVNVIRLMHDMKDKFGTTFIFSTHDPRIMKEAEITYTLDDGKLL